MKPGLLLVAPLHGRHVVVEDGAFPEHAGIALAGQFGEQAAALPGRVAAAPGIIQEQAAGVAEDAWPLKTLFNLLR